MSIEEKEDSFSLITIALLKGVIYLDDNPVLWQNLLRLQSRVIDYVREIGLDLVIHEEEGFAYLHAKNDGNGRELPSLIAKRELSYPVSLLLALLRRRLAEHDAGGGDLRLILDRDEIVNLMKTYLPSGSNEAKITDQVDSYINKAADLGFVRRLRGESGRFEVRRILKAFVDAQWLNDFDSRLKEYLSVQNSDNEGSNE
ncbi:MAG: DUF4194 domain-containing protein [Spirochaetota bacterium]